MDWSKSILCQVDSNTHLLDPSSNKNLSICGYSKLVENINAFKESCVPFPANLLVNIEGLESGDGLLANLKRWKGKWHKTCALAISSSK